MGELAVTVNNNSYVIRCDDGQEYRVAALARDLDARVQGLVQAVGQVGETRLMLMAALVLADELHDVRERPAAGAADAAGAATSTAEASSPVEDELIAELDGLARRIEAVAARLHPS